MTSVGAPMIYYGTEVGMHGGDDPDDRMPMVWDDLEYENRTKGPRGLRPGGNKRVQVNRNLLDFFKNAIELRNTEPALRRGEFSVLATHDHRQLIAYDRTLGNERLIVLMNRGPKASAIQLPEGAIPATVSLRPLFSTNGKPKSLLAKKSKANVWTLGAPPRTGGVWKVASP